MITEKEKSELEEQVMSLEQMLDMTTAYMSEIESDLEEKKRILESTNREFRDSLAYASIIQNAIQPTEEKLVKTFRDGFLINEPKDVIGGDLAWLYEKDDFTYLACMDCTGHGVPGALLSMVACFSMNTVVETRIFDDPGDLITAFNQRFRKYFHRYTSETRDLKNGLDISIVVWNKKEGVLRFNGTRQSLILTNQRGVKSIRGSSAYIGDENLKLKESFSFHPDSDTRFFLFSDGILDQFGGAKNKKFLSRRLREVLFNTRLLPMNMQRQEVFNAYANWRGDREQTDDILLIGFTA